MTEAVLLQMIVPSSAAQLVGKQVQNSTATSDVQNPDAADAATVGAVFAELLVVEPDDLTQQPTQPEATAELTLPVANPLSATTVLETIFDPHDAAVDPVNPLIQGQNPILQDLPPAIAVTDQGDVFTGLSEVPDLAPTEPILPETGQGLVSEADANPVANGLPVAETTEQDGQPLPGTIAKAEVVVAEDTPAAAPKPTGQSAQPLTEPVDNPRENTPETDLVDQAGPAPVTEPVDVLPVDEPAISTGNTKQTGTEDLTGVAHETDVAATSTAPNVNLEQPKTAGAVPQNQSSPSSAAQGAPPVQNADALPDDPAEATALKPVDTPAKPTQTDDRRAGGDAAADRVASDAAKSGQSLDQGGQFSDGRGEDRRGQQNPPLIFTAGREGSAEAKPTMTGDRSQNTGFANALLGGGQTAELDSTYDQMPARLRIAVANGVKQLTVHLQPANLGSVEVRVDGTEDGGLRATFLVQRPETLDLLQRDARILERALGDAGVSVDRDSLNFSLSDQGSRDGGLADDSEHSRSGLTDGQTGDASGPDDESLETDIPLDTAAIIEAGRIDVHI